jgi:vancomycin resistance protein YoaR
VRFLMWGLGLIVLLAGGAYVAGHYLTGSHLAQHATIAGVDVGGMTPAKAKATLTKALPELEKATVTAKLGDWSVQYTPERLGLSVDVEASVAAAGGVRTWNPRVMRAAFFGDSAYPVVAKVDGPVMNERVVAIADELDRKVVQGSIAFDGDKPQVTQPESGIAVDRTALVQALTEAWINTSAPVTVPVTTVQPAVTKAQVEQALASIATPAVSGPVGLNVNGKKFDLPVSAWSKALSITGESGSMVAKLNAEKLGKTLTSSVTGIGDKPVDAKFNFEGDTPIIVDGKPGMGLDPTEISAKLLPVLTKTGAERTITVNTTVVEPTVTRADLEKIGLNEKVSEFTTHYPPAQYRDINQSRAASFINGTVLLPGESFSYNKIVGERTPERGFVKGIMLSDGAQVTAYGGGVSQVATTTYNAAIRAGLDVTEHKPHSYYISRYPAGFEATVSWGSVDLRFTNTLDKPIVIRAWVDKSAGRSQGAMNVQMWGTKKYDIKLRTSARYAYTSPRTRYSSAAGCLPQSAAQGFSIDLFRDFYSLTGEKIRTEKTKATYIPEDHIICGKRP